MTTKSNKNYTQGKIYKIEPTVDHDEGDVYIGSTTQNYLSQRMAKHRGQFLKWKDDGIRNMTTSYILFEKYGLENCRILLLENVNASNHEELVAKEAYYIKTLKCVNKKIPLQSPTEYYHENKLIILNKQKEYYECNKEDILERNRQYQKNNNETIKQQHRIYYNENKEKIKQYLENNREKLREHHKIYNKEYNERNKEKIKAYNEANKERKKEYNKQYSEKNKEILKMKRKEKNNRK